MTYQGRKEAVAAWVCLWGKGAGPHPAGAGHWGLRSALAAAPSQTHHSPIIRVRCLVCCLALCLMHCLERCGLKAMRYGAQG